MKKKIIAIIFLIFSTFPFCISDNSIFLIREVWENGNSDLKSSDGTNSWEITWDNEEYDYVVGMALDSAEDIIICGITGPGYSSLNNDIFFVKFNSTGHYQWNKTWGVYAEEEIGHAIGLDSSDNIYIAGRMGYATGLKVVKFDRNGYYQWNVTASISGNFEVSALSIDQSGNIYVVGNNGSYLEDMFVVKFNNLGIEQWHYSDSHISEADIALDSINNIYVAGNRNNEEIYILKLDNSGSFQWGFTLDGAMDSTFNQKKVYAIQLDSTDNIYLTGHGQFDYLLIKCNSSGDIQWFESQHILYYDRGYDIALDSLNNIFIVGEIGPGTGSNMGLMKFTSSGIFQGYGMWGEEGSHDHGSGIEIDSSDNIYIGGSISDDVVLMKNPVLTVPSSAKIPSYNIFLIIGLISIISITLIIHKKVKEV